MERQLITFADHEIAKRLAGRKHFLKEVDSLINWKPIRRILSKVEIRRASTAGRDAFSAEVMFRIMLIQSWYGLSDYKMEDQLYYNFIFLWFSRLSLDNPVPDRSTICRWRARFTKRGILPKLLAEVDKQLVKRNVKIREGTSTDAAIVKQRARPRKKEIIEIDFGEQAAASTKPQDQQPAHGLQP